MYRGETLHDNIDSFNEEGNGSECTYDLVLNLKVDDKNKIVVSMAEKMSIKNSRPVFVKRLLD